MYSDIVVNVLRQTDSVSFKYILQGYYGVITCLIAKTQTEVTTRIHASQSDVACHWRIQGLCMRVASPVTPSHTVFQDLLGPNTTEEDCSDDVSTHSGADIAVLSR